MNSLQYRRLESSKLRSQSSAINIAGFRRKEIKKSKPRSSGMARLLRRLGGLRKIALAAGALLMTVLVVQTILSLGANKNDTAPIQQSQQDTKAITESFGSDQGPISTPGVQTMAKAVNTDCAISSSCKPNEMAYKIVGSVSDTAKPVVCIAQESVLDASKLHKASVVMIRVDDTTRTMKSIHYIDVSYGDAELVKLLMQTQNTEALILVTHGEAANKISPHSRDILGKFGSAYARLLPAGSSFVMLGQRGLKKSSAVEASGQEAAGGGTAQITGCAVFPMGELATDVHLERASEGSSNGASGGNAAIPDVQGGQLIQRERIMYGQDMPHCGLRTACQPDETAFYLFSGRNKDDQPLMCVHGRMVMAKNVNNAGRGLNIVILNGTTHEVLRAGHFDTYAEDSSTLEIFLEQMIPGELIAVVSFDEASTKLSSLAKQIFYELGSGMVQNLKFRASWYFIGQKGISGFTPFEELNFAKNSDWAKPVDKRICVPAKHPELLRPHRPFRVGGLSAVPEQPLRDPNKARRVFCGKYDGYEEFCSDERVDEPLAAAPLLNTSLANNDIFNVPVLVVAGLSHNALRLCLDTLLLQPGLNPSLVTVAFDENYAESGELAKLYGFDALSINVSASYQVQYAKALTQTWQKHMKSTEMIVIEEELLLTADFLNYMMQLLPVIRADDGLVAVSAWNDNAFANASGRPSSVYRVEGFPGLGYMFTRRQYDINFSGGKMLGCCMKRVWEQWQFGGAVNKATVYTLVPDVPRITRRHSDGLAVIRPDYEDLFHRRRAYTRTFPIQLDGITALQSATNYDAHLIELLQASLPLNISRVPECVKTFNGTVLLPVEQPAPPTGASPTFSAYFDGESSYRALATCFGLFQSKEQTMSRGWYKGIVRFSSAGYSVILVDSRTSSFASQKHAQSAVLSLDKLQQQSSSIVDNNNNINNNNNNSPAAPPKIVPPSELLEKKSR